MTLQQLPEDIIHFMFGSETSEESSDVNHRVEHEQTERGDEEGSETEHAMVLTDEEEKS